MKRFALPLVALLLLSACSPAKNTAGDVPSGCNSIDIASSPEKVELLNGLTKEFNNSKQAKSGTCAFARVTKVSSGTAATALVNGWDEKANGAKPVIWSPSASTWGGIVNQRLAEKGQTAIVPTDFKSFMVTPLVIAMPKPMAEALGYPNTPIGFSDIAALAKDPSGWASKGHPEWGQFRLGRTNPNFSTAGLSSGVAIYYAGAKKTSDLTLEDINNPSVEGFAKSVESSVVHYGDTTLTFLNNQYRSDRAGASLSYVSAVAVEEKSVIDYNSGNPDGITDPGETPRPPRIPLVAIYPKEGTLFSDDPLLTLNAPWVSDAQKTGAAKFTEFVLRPENQAKVLKTGFRPGNPSVAVGAPIGPESGTDAAQPQTTLGIPQPQVLIRTIDKWNELRKPARVMMVMDVSGSMGDEAGGGETKLDLAKRAAIDALGSFKDDDQVGLRIFSTDVSSKAPTEYQDVVPIKAIGVQREVLTNQLRALEPKNGTPLYTVAKASFDDMKANFDASRINAVLLLTDGKNEDPKNSDLNGMLNTLRSGSEGNSNSIRMFTIAYGSDADKATMKRMAEATNAASYDATDPKTINNVFNSVVSNF